MGNIKKDKYFLLIGLKQIKFIVLNEDNKILLDKEVSINDSSIQENLKTNK